MALTAERFTERTSDHFSYGPLAANVKMFEGGLTVRDSAGRLKPGVTGTGLICVGRSCSTYDNLGGAAGDVDGKAEAGVFFWDNSEDSDEITDAEIGDVCYIVDDHTVAKTSGGGTRSPAGRVVRIGTGHQAGQVAVNTDPPASADGDLVAANNLSDVASAATARANIGANKGVIHYTIPSLVGTGAHRIPLPDYAVTITKIKTVIDEALATGDATVTAAINSTNITGGAVTITEAGSAAGDQDEVTPSAANVSDGADDVLRLTVGGTNTADIPCNVTVEYTY